MIKEIDNLIIKPWDPRYGKLGHIWRTYNFENTVKRIPGSRMKYFIPSELVLIDYWTQKINLFKDGSGNNWISSYCISSVLDWSCELSIQEFFDLVILHINDKTRRPRCITCKNFVPFGGSIRYGYNQSVDWNLVKHTYCSNSHAKMYHGSHPEEFPLVAKHCSWFGYYARNEWHGTYNDWSRFRSLGDLDDQVKFYLARTYDNQLKFGLTASRLIDRSWRERMNSGHMYESIHLILESTREECSNLEAALKLKLNNVEYFEWDQLHSVIQLIKESLTSRPIVSPFD